MGVLAGGEALQGEGGKGGFLPENPWQRPGGGGEGLFSVGGEALQGGEVKCSRRWGGGGVFPLTTFIAIRLRHKYFGKP